MNGAKTMYFETKPFHEYEAITIDDLKDQTNIVKSGNGRATTSNGDNGKREGIFTFFTRIT